MLGEEGGAGRDPPAANEKGSARIYLAGVQKWPFEDGWFGPQVQVSLL
jgi:hypothetical protein